MKKTFTLFVALLCVNISLMGQKQLSANYNIWFDKPTDLSGKTIWNINEGDGNNPDPSWEQYSLPIGNGFIGANIMGSVATERITLNEKTLWRGGPNTSGGADYYWNVNKQSAHLLPIIRQAFTDGNYDKAERLTRENFNGLAEYDSSAEKPFRFGSFTTLGELYVETDINEDKISQYKRSLSLDSALVKVSLEYDKCKYERKSFISYPDNVMVLEFTADKMRRQNLKLSYAPNPHSTGSITKLANNHFLYEGALNDNQQKFALEIYCIPRGGKIIANNEAIEIKKADSVLFLITAATDYKMNFDPDFSDPMTYVGQDPREKTKAVIAKVKGLNFNELIYTHLQDYQALFKRVRINLKSNSDLHELPTDVRLNRYKEGFDDKGLEELYYQFGRYLLISSSRKGSMPANLQGIWHNNVDGPWRVDYHNNINVQMNYWPVSSTNLNECAQPLFDFIKTLVKPGAITAQSYFNARGWTASISANIYGFTAPLSSHDMSWNFNPMAGPWLATHIWDYYDYTRDLDFLKNEGYGLLKNSANFAVDYLWKKTDGTYTAAPSTSPEHGPIDQGTTFVHAVVREVLNNAISASKILNVDSINRLEWLDVLENLAPYQIGRYGQLMEWSVDIDDPEDSHRHVNHLFGLHPGHTLSPITTPELADAAKVVLEHRGDFATGWSMGWKLNQWARLHDGNHAYKLYGNLLKNGTLPNLWDTHPPFQIDGNFGGTAGVTEMLMQSHMGFIHLLPALPEAWSSGSVEGLLARGAFQVDIEWTAGELVKAVVYSNKGGYCKLYYKGKQLEFDTVEGEKYEVYWINDTFKR